MPSYLSATINIHNWRAIHRAFECFSSSSSCINRWMLQKQNCVGGLARDNFLMQISLQIPRSLVLNGIATKSNLINYKLHSLSLGHRNAVKIGHWGKLADC
jgi:hypothetical protein